MVREMCVSTDSFSTLPPVRLPEQVYVPVAGADLGAHEIRFELRRAADGELLAPVYSSVAAVVHCCGDYQPWLLLPADRMVELQRALGVDRIVLDLELVQNQRHGPEGACA
jgi:hypothetical protein